MAKTVFTTQELFDTLVKEYATTIGANDLRKYCEVKTKEGGESITFNRKKKGTAKDGVPSMLKGTDVAGDGGDMVAYKVPIANISAQDYASEEEMNKTNVDIKNTYVTSLAENVLVKMDDKIVASIVAKDSELKKLGVITKPIDEEIKLIIKAIRRAKTYAKATRAPEGSYKGFGVLINPEDWALLSTSDLLLNSDYANAFGGSADGEAETFFGANIEIKDEIPSGTLYTLPSNVICFGEWENSMKNDAVFFPTDGRRWHLQSVKSVGAMCVEPAMITKVVFKPTV